MKDGDCVITDFGFVAVERLLVVVRILLCAFKFSLLKVYSQYLPSIHSNAPFLSHCEHYGLGSERILFKYFTFTYLIHLRFSVVASLYKFVYKNRRKKVDYK